VNLQQLAIFTLQYGLTQNKMFIIIIAAFEQKLKNDMTAVFNVFKKQNAKKSTKINTVKCKQSTPHRTFIMLLLLFLL